MGELFKTGEFLQARVRHRCLPKAEVSEVLEGGQFLQSRVRDSPCRNTSTTGFPGFFSSRGNAFQFAWTNATVLSSASSARPEAGEATSHYTTPHNTSRDMINPPAGEESPNRP